MGIVERLRKIRQHATCEDAWYSCPKSGECANERAGSECDCGADDINAMHAAAADLIEKMGEVVREIEWSFGDNYAQCPQCYRKSDDVHAPGCKLAACLKDLQ